MYSQKLLDHFEHPRNTGDLADADASAQLENPVCGDIVRLSLKMQADRIDQIRFKAKGCVPAMACASAITELATGKGLTEAHRLTREDVVAAVGGLPQASTHAAQLAIDVLAAVLAGVDKSRTAQGN
jgi:nitrogen fixation NifU-like protein